MTFLKAAALAGQGQRRHRIRLQRPKVVQADVAADNGVIHAIDAVLPP